MPDEADLTELESDFDDLAVNEADMAHKAYFTGPATNTMASLCRWCIGSVGLHLEQPKLFMMTTSSSSSYHLMLLPYFLCMY